MHLEGNRILLREFALDDWHTVHAYATRPEVYRYQPWGPDTPEETRAWVQAIVQAATHEPRIEYTYGVTLRETGCLIGSGSLFLRSEQHRSGEIGYFLHPDYWGRGLGTEIATMLLRNGFQHFHLHRVFATCDPRNLASKRVLEKIGMAHEGRHRHTMLLRDGWRDSDVYGILEHEWQGTP